MLLYAFALDFPICEAEKLLPSLAHSTVVNYYGRIRMKIYDIVEKLLMEGNVNGELEIVELDESMFGKKHKYVRGKPTKRQWVFGLVERNTRRTYFIPVQNRKRETLLPIIRRKVRCGSKIFHDDYSVYTKLHEEGYEHESVIHKDGFVSPTGVCTNTIEGIFVIFYYKDIFPWMQMLYDGFPIF